MSQADPTEAEKRMLQFPCYSCRAPASGWCTTYPKSVQHAQALHICRADLAFDAGLLPVATLTIHGDAP